LRGDVAAATGGSKSSNYAINLAFILYIILIFTVDNRGLQGIASVLLLPAAKRGCPPSKREAIAVFPVWNAVSLFSKGSVAMGAAGQVIQDLVARAMEQTQYVLTVTSAIRIISAFLEFTG